MGLKRFIWRHTPEGALIDTIRSVVKEKSLIGGLKRMENEKWKEDNPVTSAIYKSRKYDGKKEGYVEASAVYEKKLLEQADTFLRQKEIFESQRNSYEDLLDQYEEEIDCLEKKVDRTEAENQLLQELLLRERQLKMMQ